MRPPVSLASPARASILLVDDNADGLAARRWVLEELGYSVITACSGANALEEIEKHTVDLIVTDWKMSPINGVELIAQLRRRNFRKPIVLLSAFADYLGLSKEITGADLVIQKSANEVARLVSALKRFLGVPRKPADRRMFPSCPANERRKRAGQS
jgi:CheY-like chemotaxis protein